MKNYKLLVIISSLSSLVNATNNNSSQAYTNLLVPNARKIMTSSKPNPHILLPKQEIQSCKPVEVTKIAKKKRVHRNVNKVSKIENTVNDMTIDFNYSGDISGVPNAIKEYDNKLKILKPSGSKSLIPLNIDLQAVKLQDILDAVNTQALNKAQLIYNRGTNSIYISYSNNIDVGKDAVDESLKWQKGYAPRPVLKRDGIVRFPYGEYQPVITCQPQQICDIELQSGEDISGIAIGDSINWNEQDNGIPVIYSGTASSLTPHLVLKPNRAGLETSLMVTTSRRTYMIKLKSSANGYVARVGFYYPDEMIKRFENNKQLLRTQQVDNSSHNISPQGIMVDLNKINSKYTIDGDNYPWKPTQVYDDGSHVYIQMPVTVDPRSLPGLCVLVEGDDSETKCEYVNWKYDNHVYIVDKLFDKARLMNGYNDTEQIVTIKRDPQKPGFWSRLFGG